MNNLHTKLREGIADLHLTSEEKGSMRLRLEQMMRTHPALPRFEKRVKSPYVFFAAHRVAVFALSLLVIILGTGGSAAYAAEGALPGDILYPIKIKINEPIQVALATSPAAKADVEVSLANERLQEAQMLAAQGRLDATTTSELATNLDAHAEAAQSLATRLAANDPENAASISVNLSSTLSAGSAILVDIATSSGNGATLESAQSLASTTRVHIGESIQALPAVASALGARPRGMHKPLTAHLVASTTASSSLVVASSTTATSTTLTTPSTATTTISADFAARFKTRAAAALAQAQSIFDDSQDTLNTSTTKQVQAQLSKIQTEIDAGDAAQAAADYGGAYAAYAKALGDSLRLKALLTAAARFQNTTVGPLLNIQIDRE